MATKLSSQMKRMKQEQVKQKENARKNTTITKKVGREEPIVIKSGTPLDHSIKHDSYEGAKFGMSKGCTLNMGEYESMRVDVWLTSEVFEGESIKEAYSRVEAILDEVLEESALSARE